MVPENLARVEGPNLTLRLIRPEDADYVHALRTAPAYNRHLSDVRGTAEDQRRWIEGYKAREADLRELYYVIERKDGTRCGLVRLYDIGAGSFTWGSWILDHNKTQKAALESAVLVYIVAFDRLGHPKAGFDVRRDNTNMLAAASQPQDSACLAAEDGSARRSRQSPNAQRCATRQRRSQSLDLLGQALPARVLQAPGRDAQIALRRRPSWYA